ncbi:MAG: ATP-grasp domain-containing protein [Methyloprofundus sp.]|nr:ATP-grasp domain-containing protein [Methylococcales bacterium]
MKQPRLLVLGASNTQLPIILKALELNCFVITVDNIPDNIGHRHSHQSINCSTADREAVLAYAKDLEIDGIVTFASDIATPTVAYVAGHLNLTACKLSIAETLSNKALFRQFQDRQQLDCPWFFIAQNIDHLNKHYSQLSVPVIFKPADTSGSRGLVKLDTLNPDLCHHAFTYAQSFSRANTVSIEEFVEGIDVSGDGFLINGQLHALISQKFKQGFIPTGHYFPTNIKPVDQQRIFSEIEKNCHAIGYFDGPIDFDVKISSDRITVIEMSPRLGGNGIPELIYYSSGIDVIGMTINYALGKPCNIPEQPDSLTPCASLIFGSDTAGQLNAITATEELKNAYPELIECRYNYQVGDHVPAFEHSGNSLGYALFYCPPESGYPSMVNRLQAALQISIEADFKPSN